MGGLGLIRIARPMALLGAVVTLLAALFVCLGGADRAEAHRGHADVRMTLAAGDVTEYSCPYDRGGCTLFPYLTPAVLTAPPLDPPQQADALTRLGEAHAPDPVERTGARPRAPDLHVLQVLRT
ncbi:MULTISPECIES: hypothetical protein [unclassified Streptomyces]|uniref:hypothetical protein n=1 Tax=unclassified Streptomyces TaxID=2593676 RepID=UPI0004C691F8|nr:hypothetical protein [Streptomyces sp. NRRL S-118]